LTCKKLPASTKYFPYGTTHTQFLHPPAQADQRIGGTIPRGHRESRRGPSGILADQPEARSLQLAQSAGHPQHAHRLPLRQRLVVLPCVRRLGRVPWEAIEDAARAVVLPRCDADREVFINRERRWFLEGYRRNHMQSQDAHIEDVFEKLTVQSILEPIADKFTLPLVPMRGMTSGTAKQALADRFSTSGKGTLMLLIAGDLDRRSPMTCSTTSSAMPAWTRTNSRRGSSRLPAGTPGQPYQTTEPIKPPMTFDQRLSSIPPARPDPVPNTYDFAGSSTRFRTPGYPAFRENIPR
jgi:hypothetical protein